MPASSGARSSASTSESVPGSGFRLHPATLDAALQLVAAALDGTLAVLAEADAGPADIVRMTWYVTDLDAYRNNLRDIGADAAYARLLENGARPHFIGYYVLHMGLQLYTWEKPRLFVV